MLSIGLSPIERDVIFLTRGLSSLSLKRCKCLLGYLIQTGPWESMDY
jgi:hypothetical protein